MRLTVSRPQLFDMKKLSGKLVPPQEGRFNNRAIGGARKSSAIPIVATHEHR
jgi:hypothetical protein